MSVASALAMPDRRAAFQRLVFGDRVLQPGFAPDSETTTLARRVSIILWTIVAVQGLVVVAAPWPPPPKALLFVVLYIGLCASLLAWLRTGAVRQASLALVALTWLMVNIEASITGGLHSPDFGSNIVVVLGAAVFLGTHVAWAATAATGVSGIVLAVLEKYGRLPAIAEPYTLANYLTIQAINLILAVILVTMALADVRSSLATARLELKDREEAERALRDREARLEALLRHTAIGIAMTDREGRFLRVNQSYLTMFGFPTFEDLAPGSAVERILPDDWPDMRRALQPLLDGEIPLVRGEKRLVRRDGSVFWADVCVAPILQDGAVSALVTVISDLTDRKHTEAQLLQAQKMEAVGQLAGGIAHDFNNLLTVIQGHVGLLAGSPLAAGPDGDSLAAISTAATRAADLTRQLLAFSRRQVLQVQMVQLNDLVTSLTRMISRVLGETIAVTVQCDPALGPILADQGLIEQVLMNLCVNARDAMPSGGRLVLSTARCVFAGTDRWGEGDRRAGVFACLSVADTGHGMDEATVGQIFQPFYTTKAVGRGTGLGLAMVYGIVKQHGGWIEVTTAPGEGAEFRVYLPAESVKTADLALEQPASTSRRGAESVLVVEDEPSVRALLVRHLERAGYLVREAENAPAAIERWHDYAGNIDLLLTDMVMPGGLTGRDLAERLRREKPGLRVIYMSGYSVDLAAAGLPAEPNAAFLSKPFTSTDLVQTVRRALDS
jgi:PAS domain S-box-containing protein